MKLLITICFTCLGIIGYGQQPVTFKSKYAQIPIQSSPTGTVIIYVPKNKVITITQYDAVLKCYKGKYNEVYGCINDVWLQNIEDNGMKIDAENREKI
jgi:hypothetical protein